MAETVADVVIGVSADVAPLMRETARAGKAVDKFGADMSRSTSAGARGMASALGTASGAAVSFGRNFASGLALGLVSAGLAAVTTNVRSTIDAMADMADEAKRVGVGVEVFQELQFGMKVAGVEAAEFSSSIAKFSENIGDAARGTGKLKELLEENGVAIRDTSGAVRSTTDLLADFADIIQRVPDEATRMSLITEAFGKSGKAMTLAMADGSAGLEALQQAARDAGAVVDADVIARAEELSDRFDALSARAATFFKEVAVGAAGAAAGLADMMNEMIAPGEFSALLGGGDPDSILGPGMAEALRENKTAYRELRGEIIEYGAQLATIGPATEPFIAALGKLAGQLRDVGNTNAANLIGTIAQKVIDARIEFESGAISGQEYIAKLEDLGLAAQGVGTILGDIEGVDFASASASAESFTGAMRRLGTAARAAWDAIKGAFSAGPPAPGASGPGANPPLIGGGGRPEFDPGNMDSRGAVIRAQVAIAQKQAADAAAAAAANAGGGGGGGTSDAALDSLIASLETEREILDEWYAESAALLAGATDAQLEQLGGRYSAIERLEKEHAEKVRALRIGSDDQSLSDRKEFFDNLGAVIQAGGGRANKAYQVYASGRALINAYLAASETLQTPGLPFFARAGAALSILSTGMGFVNALKGGGSGGGSARSSSGSSASAAPAARPLDVRLTGFGPDDLISGSMVSSLLDRLSAEAGDRGYRIMTAAT